MSRRIKRERHQIGGGADLAIVTTATHVEDNHQRCGYNGGSPCSARPAVSTQQDLAVCVGRIGMEHGVD